MGQQGDSANRAWDAADGQRDHDLAPYRAFFQMQESSRNLGEEVEQCIGSNGHDRRHFQTEDQYGEQQNAAPHTGQANENADDKANQDFDRDQVHSKLNSSYSPASATPMKPSRSRCRTISWAASSGDRSPVLMVTSASAGTS